MPSFSPLRPADPRHVGPYRLTGYLGAGGQGTVYVGESPEGQVVAIKVLHARLSEEPQARERFLQEIAATRKVRQFCTARVLDADTSGDQPYVVSQYVEGISLSRLIATQGVRDPDALERLAVATVTALVAIHQAGIVHRDFKPSNVVCGPDGPRVIDFGLARALDSTVAESSEILGTPAYMAPEQFSAGVVTGASDMFSWAATMAYAAGGRPPFGSDSIPALFQRILNEEPDLTGLTEPVRSLVVACLDKNPAARPSATDVLFHLLGHGVPDPAGEAPGQESLFPLGTPPRAGGGEGAASRTGSPSLAASPSLPGWSSLSGSSSLPGSSARSGPASLSSGPALTSGGAPLSGSGPVSATESLVGPPARTGLRSRRTLITASLGLVAVGAAATVAYIALGRPVTPVAVIRPAVVPGPTTPVISPEVTRTLDPDPAYAVAYSPDGKTFATGGADGAVQVWDAAGRRVTASLDGHTKGVHAVAFSPDGRTLATGSDDGTVRLWSLPSGRGKGTLTGHTGGVGSVAFSPDGRTVASASRDRTVRLWNAETGDGTAILNGHTDWVDSVAFSPDGATIATASHDRTVRLWHPAAGEATAVLSGHRYWVFSVAFSPDGKTLASASADRTVRLWDVATRKERTVLAGHRGWATAVAFSPDGRTLASGGYDRKVRLWEVASGRGTGELDGPADWVYSVAFSRDGATVTGVAGDATLRFWGTS
ncbi:serine/threonine protein kinase [Nonomuraea thailandensis]|uniref:Serine/threonine protein kinase n=1 Tax=Nonomuraea thailandensis TaxID=1188745 RepID=A0A9X2GWA4_9ACTN|nr:serine/threonine-protein kinase [Nonomuraea thailandensis]MCP2362911.1 serine/threonine protein kinase [Nonomuraea thailandensis]